MIRFLKDNVRYFVIVCFLFLIGINITSCISHIENANGASEYIEIALNNEILVEQEYIENCVLIGNKDLNTCRYLYNIKAEREIKNLKEKDPTFKEMHRKMEIENGLVFLYMLFAFGLCFGLPLIIRLIDFNL